MRRTAIFLLVVLIVNLLLGASLIQAQTPPLQGVTSTPIPDLPQLPPGAHNADWTPVIRAIDGVNMALVPAGCFMMGSEARDNEQPVHEQCIDAPFWIDVTEVTNETYQAFVDAGGYEQREYWSEEGWAWLDTLLQRGPRRYYGVFLVPEHPRVGLSWYEASAYARWRGGRLPTEVEWEYAARGPDSLTYPWGNEFDGELLNSCDFLCSDDIEEYIDGFQQTAPVGSYPGGVSWVGALDMSGNIFEWTSTVLDQERFPYPYDPEDGRENVSDPLNARRVARGSSWLFVPGFVHAAVRFGLWPHFRDFDLGVRVVIDAVE